MAAYFHVLCVFDWLPMAFTSARQSVECLLYLLFWPFWIPLLLRLWWIGYFAQNEGL